MSHWGEGRLSSARLYNTMSNILQVAGHSQNCLFFLCKAGSSIQLKLGVLSKSKLLPKSTKEIPMALSCWGMLCKSCGLSFTKVYFVAEV